MIPFICEATTTNFEQYGNYPLLDCISCTVTEERNGEFTLELEYPREGRWAEMIAVDRIILADPNDGASQSEAFRIVDVASGTSNRIQVSAEHVSYQLKHIIIGQCIGGTRIPVNGWNFYNDNIIAGTNPFTFTSDIEYTGQLIPDIGTDKPVSLRSLLGGSEGSLLDSFGGEFLWSRYSISLLASRGSDNGVQVAYAKNLTGLTYEVDISDLYTGVIAFYSSGEDYVEGSLQTVTNSYSFDRVKVLDATSDFDTAPTAAELDTWAADYIQSNPSEPTVSVDVEFVPLWQTEEFKAYSELEHIKLCDTVEVIYPPLGVDVKAKVVKTVYDVLLDRYKSISIQTVKSTLADTIFSLIEEVEK